MLGCSRPVLQMENNLYCINMKLERTPLQASSNDFSPDHRVKLLASSFSSIDLRPLCRGTEIAGSSRAVSSLVICFVNFYFVFIFFLQISPAFFDR